MTGPDRDGARPDGAPEPTDAAGRDASAPIVPNDLDALLAADALDALDADDRAVLDALLADAPDAGADAGAEAAGYAEAAARLADAVPPVTPPPSLKASIFARLDEVPQLAAEAPPEAAAPQPAPAAHEPVAPAPIIDEPTAPDAAVPTIADEAPATEPASPRRTGRAERAAERRWFQRPGAILAAAAAALLLIAGTVVGVNWGGPAGWGAQRDVQAIAAAPDAQTAEAEVPGGGTVELVWSAELGRSAVRAADLPDVGADSTYELWYIDDSGATPAGTFDPSRGGEAFVVLDGEFQPGLVVGITVEPAGGSTSPTTDPIAAFET